MRSNKDKNESMFPHIPGTTPKHQTSNSAAPAHETEDVKLPPLNLPKGKASEVKQPKESDIHLPGLGRDTNPQANQQHVSKFAKLPPLVRPTVATPDTNTSPSAQNERANSWSQEVSQQISERARATSANNPPSPEVDNNAQDRKEIIDKRKSVTNEMEYLDFGQDAEMVIDSPEPESKNINHEADESLYIAEFENDLEVAESTNLTIEVRDELQHHDSDVENNLLDTENHDRSDYIPEFYLEGTAPSNLAITHVNDEKANLIKALNQDSDFLLAACLNHLKTLESALHYKESKLTGIPLPNTANEIFDKTTQDLAMMKELVVILTNNSNFNKLTNSKMTDTERNDRLKHFLRDASNTNKEHINEIPARLKTFYGTYKPEAKELNSNFFRPNNDEHYGSKPVFDKLVKIADTLNSSRKTFIEKSDTPEIEQRLKKLGYLSASSSNAILSNLQQSVSGNKQAAPPSPRVSAAVNQSGSHSILNMGLQSAQTEIQAQQLLLEKRRQLEEKRAELLKQKHGVQTPTMINSTHK